MFRRLVYLTSVFTAIAFASAPVFAQSYARQVWNQLQDVYNQVSDNSDFELEKYVIGKLDQGKRDSWTFTLERGVEYLIIGACDNDCSDLDMTVVDQQDAVIVKDEEVDATPTARFRVNRTGEFTVDLDMFKCRDNPCFFGFGLFSNK